MANRTLEAATIRMGNRPGAIQGVTIPIPDSLQLLPDGQNPKPGQHCFRFMTPQDGDKRYVWDSRSLDEINEAKELFDKAVLEGLVPYRVGLDGKATSEVMDEFDPEAEEVIFLPVAFVGAG